MRQRQLVARASKLYYLKKESIAWKWQSSEASDTVFHLNALNLPPVYVGRNRNRKVSRKKITDSDSKPLIPITLLMNIVKQFQKNHEFINFRKPVICWVMCLKHR